MRVFVTGASGWIGRGLVPELTAAGHEVTGLARSDASARALQAAGAGIRPGSLDDLGTLRDAAAASDGCGTTVSAPPRNSPRRFSASLAIRAWEKS